MNRLPVLLDCEAHMFESALYKAGLSRIAGVDEAGRGPLAGPVVAAACIIPQGIELPGLADSKKCSQKLRQRLYDMLVQNPEILFSVSVVSAEEIDSLNILQATMAAMDRAVAALKVAPEVVLVDGNRLPHQVASQYRSQAVVKGDQSVRSISAASIIAKVTRDRIVDEYDALWPHFCFSKHKGYGTELHMSLLAQYGPLPVHRKTFSPVRELLVHSG